jgi:hypothetical protein
MSFYSSMNITEEIAFDAPVFERLNDAFHTARAEIALALEKDGKLPEGAYLMCLNELPVPVEKPVNDDPYEWDLYSFLSLDEFPYELREIWERRYPEMPILHRGGAA